MDDWLTRFDFDCARVPGVSVTDEVDIGGYDSSKRINRFGYDMSPQEIGCFLAHKKCWEECVATGRIMLILESDAVLASDIDLPLILKRIFSSRECFDIARLQGTFESNEIYYRKICDLGQGHSLCQCIGDPMGAVAYVVTPEAADGLLRASESFFQPVDVFLGSTWLHRQRYRTVKPYVFDFADCPSTIGCRRRPKQSVFQRLKIESNRFLDDVRRIFYMPFNFFR